MRTGIVLTQFFALFATTTAAVLSLAGAEREFDIPARLQHTDPIFAGRCYSLAVEGDSTMPAHARVPRRVRLTGDTSEAVPEQRWFKVAVAVRDTVTSPLGYYMHDPRWRAVGADSLDIALPGWPIGTRMRLPARGEIVTGRLVRQGDSFEVLPFNGSWHIVNWPAVKVVRAVRTSCEGEQAI